uniref:Disease resistance protein RGA3 n=1 Tax=Nelumbo nucifera TaxID=4432 RepID=A0A822ZDI5_NELNU|nr:TPA_asm: hypothetical protein HUJ06_013971 [Nelumbo nucifera]
MLQQLKALEVFHIFRCPKLDSLSTGMQCLSALEELKISDCPELHLLEDMQGLANLKTLSIEKAPSLVSFPEELLQATALQRLSIQNVLNSQIFERELHISDCPNLRSLPANINHLLRLHISKCPHLWRRCQKTGEDWSKIEKIMKKDILYSPRAEQRHHGY